MRRTRARWKTHPAILIAAGLIAVALALVTACYDPSPPADLNSVAGAESRDPVFTDVDALQAYLDKAEARLEETWISNGTENWKYYAQEGDADFSGVQAQYSSLLLDHRLIRVLDTWNGAHATPADPLLKRRLAIWQDIITGAQVELSSEVLKLGNQLVSWLDPSTDPAQIPSDDIINETMIRLFEARNEKARELGFRDFGDMILEINETGSDWFSSFADQLLNATREPYQALIAREQGQSEERLTFSDLAGMSWKFEKQRKLPGVAVQDSDRRATALLAAIGLDPKTRPIRIVERTLPRGMGGNGFPVAIPTDFRVVINSEISLPFYYRVHEIGHALHRTSNRSDYPVLKGYEWSIGAESPAWVEGMAETVAKFSVPVLRDLQSPGSPEPDPDDVMKFAPAFVRFQLANAMFELEIYKNPRRNAGDLWRALVSRFMEVEVPASESRNIAYSFYVTYPVYEQNYLIADLISWQVHDDLRGRFGPDYTTNPAVGPYLADRYWADGETVPWKEMLKQATGRGPDLNGYLASLGVQQ